MNKLKNPMITAKIKKSIQENYRIRTHIIDYKIDAQPGQFLMIWMPGIGERPMSIGDNNPLTISVANIGKVTAEICKLRDGDQISFRGPLGKPFKIKESFDSKPILCIGGGYGIVPLHFLAKTAKENKIESIAIIGGRSEKDIIWKDRLSKICNKVLITTDDGTAGTKGNVMAEARSLIENREVSAVYACGPEMMMKTVATLCVEKNIPCQISLERYMKCGVGVCGSCAIDGKLCCVDGPVFTGEEALSFKDFGAKHQK